MITYETDAAGEVAMTECAWECDSEGNWVTDCGGTFILNEGTPGDNRMAFCCYCGKSLKETFSEAGAETERCGSAACRRHVALQPLVRWQRQGENMNFIADLPKSPGTYRHRWIDHAGRMKEQTLFVGYTNARAPLLQGTEPNAYMPRKLKCCPPEGYLHADRLTPEEWGGWWEHMTPNDEAKRPERSDGRA